jgi:hypothetical protein
LLHFTLMFDHDKEPFLNKKTPIKHCYIKIERRTENIIQSFIQLTLEQARNYEANY